MVHKKNLLIITSLVLISLFVSTFSAYKLYQAETQSIIDGLQHSSHKYSISLARELAINIDVLNYLSTMFVDEIPSYQQFKYQANKIRSKHPEIQALEWVPKVRFEEKEHYEQEMQKHYPGFHFTERAEQGEMVPVKPRNEYYPVYYLEPVKGNEAALGYDASSNEARRKTLEAAIKKGDFQVTESVTLVQGNDSEKAFIAFLPIEQSTSLNPSGGGKNTTGFMIGVYKIQDIFNYSILRVDISQFDLWLLDETDPKKVKVLYSKSGMNFELNDNEFVHKESLPEFGGRKWSIVTRASSVYIEEKRGGLPFVVWIFGVLLSLFISWYIYSMEKRTLFIEQNRVRLKKAYEELKVLSRTDGLTGIADRRFFNKQIQKEWLTAIRKQTIISLLLIDIDYFKLYNDNYGHQKGDECLKLVAKTLKVIIKRPSDIVARYGGEEFVIILPDTESSEIIAWQCKEAIEDLQIPHKFSPISDVITISVGGISMAPKSEYSFEELIKLADQNLYEAKRSGRNRTVTSIKNHSSNILKKLHI